MTQPQSLWHQGIKPGVIGGISALAIALVGMVESFNKRYIVADVITMGIALIIVVAVLIAYYAAKRTVGGNRAVFINAVTAALVTSGCLAMLVILGHMVNIRAVLINASPALYKILTAGFEGAGGIFILLLGGLICGLIAGVLYVIPELIRRVTIICVAGGMIGDLLQDLIRPVLASWEVLSLISDWPYTQNGLTISGTIAIVVIIGICHVIWAKKGEGLKEGYTKLPGGTQRNIKIASFIILAIFLIVLPHLLGLFLSEVLTIVGLFILLGLGLNIVVGYAGLLDLGYVAFFAIGAYTTAILTSPELGFFSLTFWQALPFAIILGILSGVLLGIPVLKMRGDYLAIATLGFGEIIRILVLSDFLKPWLGGAQGVGTIPNPVIAGYKIVEPQQIY